MAHILCKKGYVIKKSSLDEKKLASLKCELTVVPKEIEDYKQDNKDTSFPVFTEDDDTITIPKYYGIDYIGKPTDELYSGRKIDIIFKGELRDYQKPIADLIQHKFNTVGGGILSLPCGRGKTIVAINAIVRRGVKTLVIVHKKFLVRQWKRQIKTFTNARIGFIQRDVVDVEDKDIVIGMLMSLSIKDYKESVFSQFGLVVVDECHHIAARVYSRSLPKSTCKYTLGLSATPKRSDGLTKVFHWFLGPMIYKEDLRKNNKVIAKIYNFRSGDNLFKTVLNWKTKNPNKEKMVTNVTKVASRTRFIINRINERRKRGTYCKILVLSRRRNHLDEMKLAIDESIKKDKERLKKLIQIKKNLELSKKTKYLEMINQTIYQHEKYCSHETGWYVGQMKDKKLKESESKDIIFCTFDMGSEALDLPNLNTIVLATPKPNVVQSVGRILRLENYDIAPEVIDINDQLSIFIKFGKAREAYYAKSHYHVYKYDVNEVTMETTQISYIDTSKEVIETKTNQPINFDIVSDDES